MVGNIIRLIPNSFLSDGQAVRDGYHKKPFKYAGKEFSLRGLINKSTQNLLNFLLQNATLSGKKLDYTLRKPFDSIAEYANRPTILGWAVKQIYNFHVWLLNDGGARKKSP
ncbi:MAG: hypothetical protein M1334_04455 [Patescibacteria group bacterium]|nr:hypothetical protein [Patescibacteria group bacterium]